jgi:hypothetical protein
LSAIDEAWHELVLAGIGGCTVAEAKENLQYAEFLDWLIYRKMRGSLNIGTRLESGVALLAYLINHVAGGTAAPSDFMPHADPREASVTDVMEILSGRQR